MIIREAIEARLADLKAQRDQLIANINACGGAIQDCEYWLSQLDAPAQGDEKLSGE